jgi:hypothetical protein
MAVCYTAQHSKMAEVWAYSSEDLFRDFESQGLGRESILNIVYRFYYFFP